jgi:hypothetical protein
MHGSDPNRLRYGSEAAAHRSLDKLLASSTLSRPCRLLAVLVCRQFSREQCRAALAPPGKSRLGERQLTALTTELTRAGLEIVWKGRSPLAIRTRNILRRKGANKALKGSRRALGLYLYDRRGAEPTDPPVTVDLGD